MGISECVSVSQIALERCYGCGACEALCPVDAITLQMDFDGFYYPVIDIQKCKNCGMCVKVCIAQKTVI